jgi:hypothetical protein
MVYGVSMSEEKLHAFLPMRSSGCFPNIRAGLQSIFQSLSIATNASDMFSKIQ